MWRVTTTRAFDEWFADLDGDSEAEVIAVVELLKLLGPRLGRPHADTLKGSKHANMKELRTRTANTVLRIAFAFDPDRTAILLIGGNKSGVGKRRFYKQLLEKAEALYAAHLAALKEKKKEKE